MNQENASICFFIAYSDSTWCQDSKTGQCHFGIVEHFFLWRHSDVIPDFFDKKISFNKHRHVWYQTTRHGTEIRNISSLSHFRWIMAWYDVINAVFWRIWIYNKYWHVWYQTTRYGTEIQYISPLSHLCWIVVSLWRHNNCFKWSSTRVNYHVLRYYVIIFYFA